MEAKAARNLTKADREQCARAVEWLRQEPGAVSAVVLLKSGRSVVVHVNGEVREEVA